MAHDTTTFPDELAELWQAYRERESPQARERLILQYAPLVKYVVGRIAGRLPGHVDRGDLVSSGVFGLIDAVERFDPGRGARFESYALLRIRGAIMDELRGIDWVPRSVRAMVRQIEQAQQDLESELQRTASDDEVAGRLGLPVEDVRSAMQQVGEASVLGLDHVAVDTEESSNSLLHRVSGLPGDAGQSTADQEQRTLVVESINELDERERLVVTLYYYGGLTLADIADVLGLSEARVCQMRGHALRELRLLYAS